MYTSIDNFEAEYQKFNDETIQGYNNEIKKYSLAISNGDKSTETLARLFLAYEGLYQFVKNDKKSQIVTKDTVDRVCDNFLAKVEQEVVQGKNLADNYCYLAHIATYKKDNQKALEYYNKAVEIDEKTLMNRAVFKNNELNDRQGALEDYNRALSIENDPEERKIIQHLINNIDLIRDSDSLLRNINIQVWAIIILIIAYVVYEVYKIFFS